MTHPIVSQTKDLTEPDDTDRRNTLLNNLLSVSAYLGSVLDPNQLLSILAQRVVEVVPAVQVGLVWLHEPQHGVVRVASLYGPDIESLGSVVERLRLRPGDGLVALVMRSGESLLVESRSRYREMGSNVLDRNQADLRALFELLPRDLTATLLPLRIGDETIGALELWNLGQAPSLQGQDMQLLQTFANLAAGAIKNAQLHAQMQAHQRRLEAFGAIGTAVSAAADLDELMNNALDVMLQLISSPSGMLLLYDPARAVLTVGAARELPEYYVHSHHTAAVGNTSCEDAIRYGQPIRRMLIVGSQEQPLIDAQLGSAVYLPLLAGGTVTGVVCLYGDSLLYERVDATALMMMGSLVGFAIANVVLYQDSNSERQRLLAVLNSMTEGVLLCDGQGRLAMANETARTLLALESVPYQQPLDQMPDFYGIRDLKGAELSVYELPMTRALSEVFHDQRVLLRGVSGEDTVMSFSGAPVFRADRSPDGAVVVFRDITALQKVEQAKDAFLATAAHELRSPVSSSKMAIDRVLQNERQRSEPSSTDLRRVELLHKEIAHMHQLVDNLLDLSRIDSDRVELSLHPTNLIDVAQYVLDQQRVAAGRRTLSLVCNYQEVLVVGDKTRISQVLTNLVSNAIRYSEDNTQVTVTLDLRDAEELSAQYPPVAEARSDPEMPASHNRRLALISIGDEGMGVGEGLRAKLFTRYGIGNESSKRQGLGLGLYVTREYVLRHGGAIWFESRVGVGSTFYVMLPVEQPTYLRNGYTL